MAKRYIDTGLWPKRWFRELPPAEKTAWIYILTNCDSVGVWDADLKLAEFSIGAPVNWEQLRAAANDNIDELESGKWWVVDYCKYQYGRLDKSALEAKTGIQKTLVSLLLRHGLWERYEATLSDSGPYSGTDSGVDSGTDSGPYSGTDSGVDSGTDSGPELKEKEKERVKEKDKEKKPYADGVLLTTSEYDKLVAKYGEKVAKQAVDKLSVAKQAKGYKYKSDYHAILNWVIGEVVKKGGVPAGRDDGMAWTCGECGEKYRSTSTVCVKCGWERPA